MTQARLHSLGLSLRWAALAISAAGALTAGNAHAVLIFEFIQQGPDVRLDVSGSLTGLPSGTPTSTPSSAIFPGIGAIATGPGVAIGLATQYTISGPTNFGASVFTPLSSYTGNDIFLNAATPILVIADPYNEGDSITGTGLILGKTLSDLGLSATSGLLGTWTIGTDQIQVWAGPAPAPVPGPLPLFGAAAAFAHSRRLRARVRTRF